MNQNAMLDKAKELLSIATDTELAEALGVDQTAISKVRRGRNNLGPETALRLAEILKIDPAKVAAAAYAARATSSTTRKAWEKAAALAIVMAVGTWGAADVKAMTLQAKHYAIRRRPTGASLIQRAESAADKNESTKKKGAAHEIQGERDRTTVGQVARGSNQPGRNHHQRRANHRPFGPRPPVMESRLLRPGAPRRLRLGDCAALRPRDVSASRTVRLVRQGGANRRAVSAGTSARRAM